MRAETPGAFGMLMRWAHVPAWVLIVSLVGFVRLYLRAGRLWLAWTVCVVRTLSLILNFVCTPNLNYREITALRHVPFLGETVVVAEGVPKPLDADWPFEPAVACDLCRGCRNQRLAAG
jgi:two-component system, LuxR family, sensor kinase FixL